MIRDELVDWTINEAKSLQQGGAKIKDDVRSILLKRAAQRLGDSERFTRNNAGLPNNDAATLIDDLRTPVQAAWWTSTMAQGGLPKMLKSKDIYIHSITVARIFHRYSESYLKFNWWEHCLFFEEKVRNNIDHITISKCPTIIQQMGEFNVWFEEDIYRTKSIEHAITMWIIIMNKKRDCKYTMGYGKKYDLGILKNLLLLFEKNINKKRNKGNNDENDKAEKRDDSVMLEATDGETEEEKLRRLAVNDIFSEVSDMPLV